MRPVIAAWKGLWQEMVWAVRDQWRYRKWWRDFNRADDAGKRRMYDELSERIKENK